MATWREGGYTWYGRQTLAYTAARQPSGSMTCWAYSLGAILGVPWSTIALHTSLDDMIHGQGTGNTRRLYEELNRAAGANGWGRLREPARWYSSDWAGAMLERNFPQALAITGHFVVALAIGKADNGTDPDRIRYWDPGDAQIRTVTVEEFIRAFRPEFGVGRA